MTLEEAVKQAFDSLYEKYMFLNPDTAKFLGLNDGNIFKGCMVKIKSALPYGKIVIIDKEKCENSYLSDWR